MQASTLDITGAVAQLNSINLRNVDKQKDLKKIIRKVLSDARKQVSDDASRVIGSGYEHSNGDPRQAYKAVRTSVYKKVFGGNINILTPRKAGESGNYQAPRKYTYGSKHRGNCHPRSTATDRIDGYTGKDRGFILRWINDGMTKTPNRQTRYGSRDKIEGNRWFCASVDKHIQTAADNLAQMVSRCINEVWHGR